MSTEKGKLKPNDYKCIRSNFTFLKENLDAIDIIDSLFQAEVLSEDDMDSIKSKPTRIERTDALLLRILNSGPGESFNIFLQCLKHKYPQIEQKLRSYDSQITTTYSNSQNEIIQCSITFKTMINGKMRDLQVNINKKRNCWNQEFHRKFIPFNDISMNHFDYPFKHPDFVKLTKALGDLVVKLERKITSPMRPSNLSAGDHLYGTGRITFSKSKSGTQYRHCKCKECELSESPMTEWGEISVVTAAHVVFDQLEAENSVCILWYNSIDSRNTVTLEGLETFNVNVEHDRSHIVFVTHDMDLVKTLMNSISFFRAKHQIVYDKYKAFPNSNLAIMVSHPHSLPKQVSIGTYKRNELYPGEVEGTVYTYYTYDLQSCTGSGGAPVYFLGKKDVWSMHPHIGTERIGDTVHGKSAIEYESV